MPITRHVSLPAVGADLEARALQPTTLKDTMAERNKRGGGLGQDPEFVTLVSKEPKKNVSTGRSAC